MNPFQFSADDSLPLYGNPARVQWLPRRRKWKWPADYRRSMGWVFTLTILTAFVNIARAILYPRSHTLLQNVLVGPPQSKIIACRVPLKKEERQWLIGKMI